MKRSIINAAIAVIIAALAASALASCAVDDVRSDNTSDTTDTAAVTTADTADTTDAESTDDSSASDTTVTTAPDTAVSETTAPVTEPVTTTPETTAPTSTVTIKEVMAHIGVRTARGISLAYYTENNYTEGSDYTIYVYTDLNGTVVRRVYEYLLNDENYEDFKADHLLDSKKNNWVYEDDYRLVLVDNQSGFMFNPQTEFDLAVNDPANHVYY